MAVLAMYYRIFSASRLLRYCTWVMAAMMAGWGIAVCAVSSTLPITIKRTYTMLTSDFAVFACDPIRGFWDKSIPSKCIDQNKFFIGITLPNIFFDVATVVLPVREVWHLQLKREKKWAITSIFLLGGRYVLDPELFMQYKDNANVLWLSVVVASIARLILFLIFKSSENVTQVILFGHLASSIEVCLAIIAACLPSCAPLLKRTLGKFVSTAKSSSDQGNASDTKPSAIITIGQKSSRKTNNSSLRRDDNDLQGSFERLDDSTSMQGSTDGLYLDGPGQVETKPGKWKQIHVVRDFRVQSNEDIPMRDL